MSKSGFDLVIKNGRILNGSGNTWYYSDIGINNDIISFIGKIDEHSDTIIDATGLIVAPGFIDIHNHSDTPILVDPRAMSAITQGVTTIVIGNCGTSASPMNQRLREIRKKYWEVDLAPGFSYDWSDLDSYVKKVETRGVSLNVATLTGHGTMRQCIMGNDSRAPTISELTDMKDLLRESLRQGSFGLSTGLIYAPSQFADTEEIIELAKELRPFNALYVSHIRGEGKTVIPAVSEAIRIGKEAKVRVQISHFKVTGSKNWRISEKTLDLVEEARNRKIDVDFDQYPYASSSTSLSSLLPPWIHEGGVENLLERIKDPMIIEKVRLDPMEEMEDWSKLLIVNSRNTPQYEGFTLLDISERLREDPTDVMCNLLTANEGHVMIVLHEMDEYDVRKIMSHPLGMVGSDGRAIAPDSIYGRGLCHPRYYGTFPRILAHYVRDEKVINLQEAVRKMTSAPARRLGMTDRGLLLEGMKADITIFDPIKIRDKATFKEPHQYSEGIEYVIINGIFTIKKGIFTEKYPGKVLRKQKKQIKEIF